MPSSRHLTSARHFDRRLPQLRRAAATLRNTSPPSGWIKAIRQSLGQSTAAFGRRMGVTQQTAFDLERREKTGALTLALLKRAAQALDCEFVYALVPRQSLRETLATQARRKARERIASVSHSMELEAQGLNRRELRRRERELTHELERRPRDLWR